VFVGDAHAVSLPVLGRPLSGRVVEKLSDGTLEVGHVGMHRNYFVRADWLRRVDVGIVHRPLVSAVTTVKQVAVGP
jgi:hypothetical protein